MRKKFLENYAAYLDEKHIPYNRKDSDFYVKLPLKIGISKYTFIKVELLSGLGRQEVEISDSFGTCYGGRKAADKLAQELKTQFPAYTIWVEKYGDSYEIDVAYRLKSADAEELQEKVERFRGDIEKGSEIGERKLGEDFEV